MKEIILDKIEICEDTQREPVKESQPLVKPKVNRQDVQVISSQTIAINSLLNRVKTNTGPHKPKMGSLEKPIAQKLVAS